MTNITPPCHGPRPPAQTGQRPENSYAALNVTTNFSFLRGASHPHELVARAKELGLSAIAITDRNTLAGAVRMHIAGKAEGIQVIIGARLDLDDGPSILCYPTNRHAYGRLSQLITLGKMRAPKGECQLHIADLIAHGEGQILIVLPPGDGTKDEPNDETVSSPQSANAKDFPHHLHQLARAFPGRTHLAARHGRCAGDDANLAKTHALAKAANIPLIAADPIAYHTPARKPLADVLTCIREKTTIHTAGRLLDQNAEAHIRSPTILKRLYGPHADAIARTNDIAQACQFSMDELGYDYPNEPVPDGISAQEHLANLTWAGAQWRYPNGVPDTVSWSVEKELSLIDELGYAKYFLTVEDMVRWARSKGILCQGRGSAANSAVCYCLGITAVDPATTDLLFERFLSKERREPPDIDIDFEHERREEVMQYIYARYGRARASLTATVISYRPRSAVREVCKALGLTEDIAATLAGTVWGSWGRDIQDEHIRQAGLDPHAPMIGAAITLTQDLIGFPRHLSQHVGGFILTNGPLSDTVPIGPAAMDNRTFIEWDKDDIDALGILKIDVLALGMLTCIQKCFGYLSDHKGENYTLDTMPKEDPSVYAMLQQGDSLGVFQVESRAQMNMLPRLKPACFYDLVIEVAIVRPGPIQGDMVHPYLRRRKGLEPVHFPAPSPKHGDADELQRVLGRTLGVPLFQEQAMRIAMEAAKFTPDEANLLRRAMATFRKVGTIHTFQEKMVERMAARGYDRDFAARCFSQIEGFGEYGFPESHAASFALLVYASSWLKRHHPEVFTCGLLNSQPMGFYAPAQLVRDAREHGVDVRPADINHSDWDCTLEPKPTGGLALRLGLRLVDGAGQDSVNALIARRGTTPFSTMDDVRARGRPTRKLAEALAAADAFKSLNLNRRQAIWALRGQPNDPPLPLFDHANTPDTGVDDAVTLPDISLSADVLEDYATLKLSLKAHPLAFLRDDLQHRGAKRCCDLNDMADGAPIILAGLVLVRQRPGSAKGVVFITLEDETGVANLVVWPDVMTQCRPVVMGARLMEVHGRIQSSDNVIHIVAKTLIDQTSQLAQLRDTHDSPHLPGHTQSEDHTARGIPDQTAMDIPVARADEVKRPGPEPFLWTHPRNVRTIPKSRDFH